MRRWRRRDKVYMYPKNDTTQKFSKSRSDAGFDLKLKKGGVGETNPGGIPNSIEVVEGARSVPFKACGEWDRISAHSGIHRQLRAWDSEGNIPSDMH